MPKISKPKFLFQRKQQISDSHCGPAVLQMLLHEVKINVTQKSVEKAGNASRSIKKQGMRVDQLGLAVKKLAPQMKFWYKDHGSLKEIETILTEHNYPVGVEWQGMFKAHKKIVNDGHYSIVAYIDKNKKELILVDPYKDFIKQDRIFSFKEFEKRWWDTNEVRDKKTDKKKIIKDIKMFFIITRPNESFPKTFGMKKY